MRALLLPALLLLPFAAHADAVDTYLEAEMKRLKIPGLTFGVIQDGKLVRTGAYGLVDIEHDVLRPPAAAGLPGPTRRRPPGSAPAAGRRPACGGRRGAAATARRSAPAAA